MKKTRKKIGRNDPCWCGSGKKFKKCHYGREFEPPLTIEESKQRIKKAFDKSYCIHPEAGKDVCSEKIVKAHTIQRNGGLSKIAQNNHVNHITLNPYRKPGMPKCILQPIGIKKASVFTGFCEYHDTQTFKPIEQFPFTGQREQIFLLAYRSLCKEVFLKRNQLELQGYLGDIDKGRSPAEQREIQLFLQSYAAGVSMSAKTFEEQKARYDRVLMEGDYSQLSHFTFFIDQSPEIACSGTSLMETDFCGRMYGQLGNPRSGREIMNFSMIPTESGGVISFATLDNGSVSRLFMESLQSLPKDQLPDAIVRYAFEYFENTFFSPTWWELLTEELQDSLIRRMESCMGPDDVRDNRCLLDDGFSYVKWKIIEILNE